MSKRILVDADGCPVVDIAIRVAATHNWGCTLICDTAHHFSRPGADTVTVDKGADSVDFALVNLVKPGDIVVTQDYGLAAMCLAKQAVPLNQNGLVYHAGNIDALLHSRYEVKKLRRAGGHPKGPKKRTPQQDADFETALVGLMEKDGK